MSEQRIVSSHSLEHLAEALAVSLSTHSLFARPLLITPSTAMKEWLQLELCKRAPRQGVLGLEFASWERAVHLLSQATVNRTAWLGAIWHALDEPEERNGSLYCLTAPKRLARASELADLFVDYSLFGPSPESEHRALFERILQERGWAPAHSTLMRAPVQTERPIILFAVDFLPPAVYQFFCRAPNLAIFRFSPCAMFFEDLRSTSERKWLVRQGNEALDELLRDTHPLLANWSRLGRRMLAQDAGHTIPMEENYELESLPGAALHQLQSNLLMLENSSSPCVDTSIRLLQTGPSRLAEVETIRDEILQMRSDGIPFHDIRIYAPKIESYAPLLECVFEGIIPLRIARNDLAGQSPFGQGLLTCMRLSKRWENSDFTLLLDCSAVQKKMGWQPDDIERFKQWIAQGFERAETPQIWLKLDQTWQIPWSESERFEEFMMFFHKLQETLRSFQEKRTLSEWAATFESLATDTLEFDETSLNDRSMHKAFQRYLKTLRSEASEDRFPFIFVESLLHLEQIEENAPLHAVRAATLAQGSLLPARALILIGMDEESFPRCAVPQGKAPTPGDWDRYLMLQAIFSAREKLVMSYGHLSKDDGKAVNPSILVQELVQFVGITPERAQVHRVEVSHAPASLLTETQSVEPLQDAPRLVNLQDLTRFLRSPIQRYLEEIVGLALPEEPTDPWDEFTFSPPSEHLELQGRGNAPLPPGLFGAEASSRLNAKRETLREWGFEPESIELTETGLWQPLEITGVSLVGKLHLSGPQGVVHLGADSIEGVARKWPELLGALCFHNATRIYCLRTKRIREVANPRQALEDVVNLFLEYRSLPLRFHPEWADALLRGHRTPDPEVNDRALQWALQRSPAFDLAKPSLEGRLTALAALFPSRGAHAEI